METPLRALVVSAHPDDVDFGAAGTVAQWVAEGAHVSYCIITDGDAGGFDPNVSRSEIPEIRRAEQWAAAAAVGVEDVTFLGYRDGSLGVSMDLRRDITRVIRETRPDRVICQSPRRNLDRIKASHPDHLAAGEATLCAVYPDARNPFAHPELAKEGLAAHTVKEVWLMADPTPNRFVDVTSVLDAKLAAVAAHKSQLDDPERVEAMILGWLSDTAQLGGMAPDRYAESFRVVDTA